MPWTEIGGNLFEDWKSRFRKSLAWAFNCETDADHHVSIFRYGTNSGLGNVMHVFFVEWGRLLIRPVTYSLTGWPAAANVAKVAIPTIGGAAAFVSFVALAVPLWASIIAAICVAYLAVTGGMAWERSQGQGIAMGPLVLDEKWPDKIFGVRIENTLIEPLINVRATITRIVDENGDTLLSPSWPVHWRDKPVGLDAIELLGGHAAEAGVFEARLKASGIPRLAVRTPKDIGIVTKDVPIEKQPKRIEFDLVITSETKDGTHRKPVKRTFAIAPWPGTSTGYKVID